MTEKVCQLYKEEQVGKLREERKAVPSSKMPALGWDIAETQLQKGNKSKEVQELSELTPTDSSTPPGNDRNGHTNNNNTRAPQVM